MTSSMFAACAWSCLTGSTPWSTRPMGTACQSKRCNQALAALVHSFSDAVSPSGAKAQTARHQQSFYPLQVHRRSLFSVEIWAIFGGAPRGIRGGSVGDPRGIHTLVGGSAMFLRTFGPRFGGGPSETTAVFYNFKKGKKDVSGVGGHHWVLGVGARPCLVF